MKATLGLLLEEYDRESYTTYPIGFYKNVTLNEEEAARIGEIIKETTGLAGRAEIEKAVSAWYAAQQNEPREDGSFMAVQNTQIEPAEGLTYERFEELMDEVDDILGGGSNYEKTSRKGNAGVPKTYEDAAEEYRQLTEEDRLTGGYARLFSDYMVLFLGILPVFLAVTRCLRDKRAGMQELIYARKCSSLTITTSRYLAMIVMLVLPVLALSVIPLSQCLKFASAEGISADVFAYVKYTFGWLLPTIMAVTAVGMVLTELTDTALAVLVQGIWWFLSIFASASTIGEEHMAGILCRDTIPYLTGRRITRTSHSLWQTGFCMRCLA